MTQEPRKEPEIVTLRRKDWALMRKALRACDFSFQRGKAKFKKIFSEGEYKAFCRHQGKAEEALDFQSEYIRLLEAVVINAEQFAASVQEEEGFYPAVYNRQGVLREALAALEEWRKKNAD